MKCFASGSAYVASKLALAGLTDCWRTELRKHNVRVMQINPSEVLTDFSRRTDFQSQTINPERKRRPTEIAHMAHANAQYPGPYLPGHTTVDLSVGKTFAEKI
jgi:3-oxoacyl-[acyl-carrier protein] reductase